MLLRQPPPTLFPYTTLFRSTPDLTLNLGIRMEVAGGVSEVNNILSNLDRRKSGTIGAAPVEVRENIVHFAHTARSEEHTSELQSRENLVCRLLLEKKKKVDT